MKDTDVVTLVVVMKGNHAPALNISRSMASHTVQHWCEIRASALSKDERRDRELQAASVDVLETGILDFRACGYFSFAVAWKEVIGMYIVDMPSPAERIASVAEKQVGGGEEWKGA